jgi:hypothetical protein
MALKVGESRAMKKFGSHLMPVAFPGCENVPFRTDEYWDCLIERFASTINHQVFYNFKKLGE